jgi:hypothetical protein
MEVAFHEYPLAVADATKRGRVAIAASGPQGVRVEISPPGVHGQAPRLARRDVGRKYVGPIFER